MSLLRRRALLNVGEVVDGSFKLSINTALGIGNTFTWPLPSGETYDFMWTPGDGSQALHVTSFNDPNASYDYSIPFNGQVSATGKIGGLSFSNGGDKLKVTSVDNWGDVGFDNIFNGFYGCTNLTTLPDAPIAGSGSITNAAQTFRSTGITSISDKTFSELVGITSFLNCLLGCGSLTAVPSDLFKFNTSVTNFNACFQSSGLISIPTDLFRYNIATLSFRNTFTSNSSLSTIPTDIFRYNIVATDFGATFSGNIALTSLPNNLFFYNPLVILYNNTFLNCRNMALPATLFNLSNLSGVSTFEGFMNTTSTSFSNTGTIQDIWNYALTAISINTFRNQTSLSNYPSIPNNWKGL